MNIVVPIYNAYDAVRNCLKSLQEHQCGSDNITLINDASTDTKISPLIKYYCNRNHWKLVEHNKNKGFVVTANEGLMENLGSTILLNSDTIVSKNWLLALTQAVESNPNVGTVTVWSNNAEICSFPFFLKNNKPQKNIDKISEVLYKQHIPYYPSIPTAVGFCMLISKKAKQLVGYFDEGHFGHGYGEENDYSLRVTKAGLTNILCDNAYVAHVGNQSFADMDIKPSEETMQRLLEKHPDYLTMIQEYIKQDPLSDIRKNLITLLNKEGIEF